MGVTAGPGDSGHGSGVWPMSLEIRQEAPTPGALGEHARISIAFVVDRILEVTLADGGSPRAHRRMCSAAVAACRAACS